MTIRQAILGLSVLAAVAAPSIARAEPAYKLLKQVAYAELDDGKLTMDVVVPRGKANGLGIIDVASGAGYNRINEVGQERILEAFCSRGYTVFVVRPGPTTKFDVIAMASHVQQAITYVKNNDDALGVDGDDLGLLSTSAGVHLVALVAISADDQTRVKAAGVYFPPTDFLGKDGQNLFTQADSAGWQRITQKAFPGSLVAPNSVALDAGGTRDPRIKMPEVSRLAPRFMIVHGDLDQLESIGKKNLLFSAMRDAGVATDMIVRRPGNDPAPTIQAEVKTLADWFDKQLAQN